MGVWPDRYTLMGMGDRPGTKAVQLYKDWEAWAAEGSVDGLCAEQTCPHEHNIAPADTSLLRGTLPEGFPVYAWADTAWWFNRDGGPFGMTNWNPNSVQDVLEQVRVTRQTGHAGIFLHSMYHYTAADSGGQPIGGYGVLPREEYFAALRAEVRNSGQ